MTSTPRSGTKTPQPHPTTTATTTTSTSHPAHTLLSRAHSPTTTHQIFTSKILHKPLLLTPTTIPQPDKRSLRRHVRLRRAQYHLSHAKPKPLSAAEKRLTGLHRLQKSEIKYSVYQGLNELWNGYMLEILGFTDHEGNLKEGWETKKVSSESVGGLLVSADFHGAEVEVVRCRDVGRVGVRGVVVRDQKFGFVVVTEGDGVRTVPKGGAVLRYQVVVKEESEVKRRIVFEVQGGQIEYRAVERANRKFKWRNGEDYL